MDFDLRAIGQRQAYKLLLGAVVPRPIALVTTAAPDGRVNAGAFSFFNLMGYDPPVVALGIEARKPAGGAPVPKDTAANIRASGEFVINLVDEALAERMNICSIDFPPEIDELAEAGLTPAASVQIAPPRIAEAPVSLECRRYVTVELGQGRNIVIGEVLHLHMRDGLADPASFEVASERLRLIARMHGDGWYARTTDLFQMKRIPAAAWQKRR